MAEVSDRKDAYDFSERRNESSDDFQLDIQAYLRILRKHKWVITLGTALVTGAALLYVLTATPVYRSTATLLIEAQKANLVSIEELYGVESEDRDYYLTQYELLKSRRLARRVVKHLGLHSHLDLNPGQLDADKSAVETIKSRLTKLFTGSGDEMSGEELPSAIVGAAQTGDSSMTETAYSDSMMEETASELDILQQSGILGSPGAAFESGRVSDKELDRAVSRYLSKLTISPVRNTKLVKLSYESVDSAMAAKVANTVGEQYILSYLDAKMEMTMQASKWLNERLAQLKITLDASEQRLIQYKEANNLIDVNGSVGKLNETTLLLATTELAEAQSKLSDLSELYEEVKSVQAITPEYLDSIPAVQDDALVRSVKIEQGQRQRELDELLNRYGPKHPRVVDATSRLASLDDLMQQHTGRVVSTIEKNYKLAGQRVASLKRTLSAGRQEIQAIGKKSFELDSLEREVSTNRALYDTFFARVSETRSADQMETANARISDRAAISDRPVKPQKQLIVGLAALASLVLLSLLAILYESMDDTIKGTADIESKLRVRLLGTIPLLKTGLLSSRRNVPINPMEIDETHSTFVEAIRTIRTALNVAGGSTQQHKTIVVTSSIPGEGKSTASLNIAYAMSKLEKVILLDADMRRPAIARSLKMDKNQPGLSNLISGSASVQDCIKRRVIGELDIIPCGDIPDHPLELISSSRFAELISKLGDHYDRIIIDSAPTQAVSDALVLGSLADSVVYIVKSHATSYDLVKRGLERLSQMDISVAGIVMTQVDFDKIKAYGGDHYYQGYYDYYGYGKQSKGWKMRGKKSKRGSDSGSGGGVSQPVAADAGALDFEDVYTRAPQMQKNMQQNLQQRGIASVSAGVGAQQVVPGSEQVTAQASSLPAGRQPSAEDLLSRLQNHQQVRSDGTAGDLTMDLGDEALAAQQNATVSPDSDTVVAKRKPPRFEESDFDLT